MPVAVNTVLSRFVKLATTVLVWIGGLLVLAVMCLTIADVVARWVFKTGFIGLVDVTQFAVVGFAYLSLPHVFQTNSNVAIELFDHVLTPRWDAGLRVLASVLSGGVMLLLLRYGWVQAMRAQGYGDVSQNIGIPMVWFWWLILTGLSLSLLIVLIKLVQSVSVLVRGEPLHAD